MMLPTSGYPTGRGAVRAKYVDGILHVISTTGATIYSIDPVTGRFLFGSPGLASGSCFGNNLSWTKGSAAQDEWYLISDAAIADGTAGLTGVTHDGNGKLTATNAGRYLLSYGVAVNNPAGLAIELTPRVDGTEIGDGRIGVDPTGAAQHALSSTALLALSAGGAVDMAIRTTDTGTPTLGVQFYSLSLVHVGE